jgi:acetoin utilization deacetylase AcuC-like enzyme
MRVHAGAYVNRLLNLSGKNAWLDIDTTAVSPGSVTAAKVAAGTTIKAVESVFEGPTRRAFALVRPPGHHAESVRARGFCLFNNVAVACAHAQSELGCERVLIVDWDAHHANGTQEIFYADPTVLLFDIHRAAPFYPGTGYLEQVGGGLGEGTTINVPLPGGSGDAAYLHAMRNILVPAADWFEPDLVIVSAGFDPHPNDLAMNVSYGGFEVMTSIVTDIAERHCDGRIVFALEGGYNHESLSRGVHSVLRVLTGLVDPVDPPIPGMPEVQAAAEFHKTAFADDDQD